MTHKNPTPADTYCCLKISSTQQEDLWNKLLRANQLNLCVCVCVHIHQHPSFSMPTVRQLLANLAPLLLMDLCSGMFH